MPRRYPTKNFARKQEAFLSSPEGQEYVRSLRERTPEQATAIKEILVAKPARDGYVIDEERPHLGGYLIGGDDATIYPDLWDWLIDKFALGSVLDIGCGDGIALSYFREHGCHVLGYDGIPQPDFDILEWDFTEGAPPKVGQFDMVWCCEFVEHVEEQFVPNFLATFRNARYVVMTHGAPGQPGHHHVNNQFSPYWKGALAAIGFHFDRELTAEARRQAASNHHPSNHFVRSGLVFRRRSPA